MKPIILLLAFLIMPSVSMAEDKTLKEKSKEITEKVKEDIKEVLPTAEKEERKDMFNLTSYDPVYFIYSERSTKVQASFKYKLLRDYNLYGGYTHLILWDLNGESRPFLDVNYNPELFYRWDFKGEGFLESIDAIAYGHLSNGKELGESRSMDYTAGRFNFKTKLKKNRVLRTSLKVRIMGNFDQENEELRKYYGPFELKFTLTEFLTGVIDKGEITGRFYTGGNFGEDFSKGGQEIGLSFRIYGLEITPAFYIQYFHGYSEALRFFDQKENIIRFGLLL